MIKSFILKIDKNIKKPKSWKSCYGLYAIDTDTEEVYFHPVAIGISPMQAMLLAGLDGASFISDEYRNEKHQLYPCEWLKKNARSEPAAKQLEKAKIRAIQQYYKDENK